MNVARLALDYIPPGIRGRPKMIWNQLKNWDGHYNNVRHVGLAWNWREWWAQQRIGLDEGKWSPTSFSVYGTTSLSSIIARVKWPVKVKCTELRFTGLFNHFDSTFVKPAETKTTVGVFLGISGSKHETDPKLHPTDQTMRRVLNIFIISVLLAARRYYYIIKFNPNYSWRPNESKEL